MVLGLEKTWPYRPENLGTLRTGGKHENIGYPGCECVVWFSKGRVGDSVQGGGVEQGSFGNKRGNKPTFTAVSDQVSV